ncbi:SusC/RagA family TonB-linked outer membrane protein [Pedobacter roseus]|uniref:TonB-dependent receptor n=1 Tax=Pedobacter roseus TaxID=336820 RepID=A0A7G9QGB9_9SPHI|nr:TonB-dependent receptor [Pedobacter roseus]QNN42394.1 TonB-dependent receptor [Pedobacter roseus]
MNKLKKRQALLTGLFLMFSLLAFAQVKITGVVKDSDGGTVPGATIMIKGTSTAVSTTPDGKFSISAPADAILTISFIGYDPQDVPVNGKTTLNVVLTSSTKSLNEVVVVGYGTQKKVNLSGSVNTVDTKNIVNRPVTSLTNALQGAVPGMAIKATPGDVGGDIGTINVRGRGNLGTSEPLFVVDGVIVSSGDFARINTNDVENISILKDASASAIYGSRAAYGVVLITTKRGKKGEMTINYNAYYGIQSATILPSWVGAYDYATLRNEAAANAGKAPVYSAGDLTKIQNQSDPDRFPDNDWYALTLKNTAPVMEHAINVSGGDKTRYYLSGAYFNQNSLVPGKDLTRYSLRANTETQVSDKFKVGTNISFIRDGFDNENGLIDFTSLNRLTPLVVNKQTNGNWGSMNGGKIDGTLAATNTVRKLEEGGRNSYNTNRFIGNLNGTYTPIKGLEISGLVSYNFYNTVNSAFISTIDPILDFNTGAPLSGTAVNTNQLTEEWQNIGRLLTQATASYEKTIDKHYAKLLAGASYENNNTRVIKTIRKNFVSNDLNAIDGGSSDPLNTTSSGGIQQKAFESVFGRFNYAYNDRYLFEASVRLDASSQFAPGHRWGAYPSFSGAWRISQEDFMKNIGWISELKLRASWGKLGNVNNVGNYDYFDGLKTGTAVILDESKQDGVFPNKIYNPRLSWEKINMTNIGLDVNLFKKLSLQVDAFDRLTNDILLPDPTIPTEAGLISDSDPLKTQYPSINLGSVRNRGFELSLTYNGQINDFKYSIGGNLSKIWNKVEDLGGTSETPPSGYYINRVGQPIGSFYMLQSDGLFTTNAEVAQHAFQANGTKAGDIKYVDQNGDNKIDGDDRVIAGNDVPYLIYGLNFSANYKNFDFAVLANGVSDVKVYLESEASQAFFNGAGAKQYVLDRWTPGNPNPNAAYPRVLISGDNTQNLVQSDFWLFNADYLRIKSLTLGYTLPKSVLDKIKIRGLRIYASSNNPFTIRGDKRLKDFDPEAASQRAAYPQLKTYSFGINLTL